MQTITDLMDNFFHKTLQPREKNDSDQHLIMMFGVAMQMQAKKILELGVRWGDTTEPFVVAANLIGGHVTSVDINNTQWNCPDSVKENYTFVKSDAIKFLENEVAKGTIYDLILVDDWHSYKHVKRELELIDRLTTKKSIILLHDLMAFNENAEYFMPVDSPEPDEWALGGPCRAVFELDKTKWEWATIPYNNGLTILRKTI